MNNMVTTNQLNYLEALLNRKKNIDNKQLYYAAVQFDSYRLTKEEASEDIKYLLTLEDKTEEELSLGNIKSKIYTIISKKKTQKGKKALDQINQKLGKTLWYKGQQDTLTDDELMLVKDIVKEFK